MWRKVSGIVLTLLLIWNALANIAPDVFQIKGKPLLQWFATNGYWVILPLVLAWLVAYLWSIETRLDPAVSALRDEARKREDDYGAWLRDRTNELKARKVNAGEILAINTFISRGTQLRSDATAITSEQSLVAPVQTQHCLKDIGVWENDVREWLKRVRPGFEEDFIAECGVPTGSTMRDTVIRRVECRLERLRALKASFD